MPTEPSDEGATGSRGQARAMPGSLGAPNRQLRSVGIPGGERGGILVVMVLLLVALMGVVGFAVDLGGPTGTESRSNTEQTLRPWPG